MSQEFDQERNTYIDRDPQGIARQLIHTHAPVLIDAPTPQAAAADYLGQFREPLGLTPEHLQNLSSTPADAIQRAPVELRFSEEKGQFDTATVAYHQTDLGLPVWQAGVAVQMKVDPFRVTVSQSTVHPDLEVKRPPAKAVTAAKSIDEKQLARLLGLTDQPKTESGWDPETLKIERRGLVIYRHESARRASAPPPAAEHRAPFQSGVPTLPLPPVAEDIREGQHYVCARIDFGLSRGSYVLHWVALIEVESLSVLYLEVFTSGVNGMVFEIDPITTNGGPLPSATTSALNPVRVSSVLPGLNPPSGGTQSLTGENVQLSDVEKPTVAVPTEATGTDFNFDARTDNFAAVNAYYHCDKFFRLLDGMGFTRASYFGGTTFPTAVDHRGLEDDTASSNTYCPLGQCINAHCVGTSAGNGIQQTTFALADTGDTTNPLGIANDYRVVLHELGGHGVLYNHISSANFKFSHSAGDGVAAILNDPGSQATDRFVTFPWVNIGRRHDRTPAAGWGWEGQIALNPFNATLDNGGYNNEQILSTTHFRIYQSIGGDSNVLATQQFAARITVYMIMRAIGTLTQATTPADASAWATALMGADQGDWLSENVTGGCYSKVIRWSFEKQGLYQPSGTATPNNNEGAPPPIDVYVDDGRGGEYGYQPNWWSCESVWNRLDPDGLPGHQDPAGSTNYCYVKVKNRGSSVATGVVVNGYHCRPGAGLVWPDDLQPMTTAQLTVGTLQPNSTEEQIVGPFEWTPVTNAFQQDTMLMIVSATGDTSNVANFTPGRTVENWRLVPNDNNIGQRNVALIRLVTVIADSGSFGNVCLGAFKDEQLVLSNSGFNLITISDITSSSGDFILPSVLTYPLTIAPGASVEVPIRFEPTSFGFKAASITIVSNDPTGPRIIDVSGTAGAPELATAIANSGSFGNVCLGSFVDELLTINNSGTCALLISSITGSANFLPPSVLSYPLLVGPGDSIDVVVRFQPSTHGTQPGTITIFSNDPASPHVVAVSGVAPEPKANLIIADTGDFGEVRLGKFIDRDLVINNPGPCQLSVTGLVSSAPIFVTPQVVSFPLTVDGGESIAIPIRFQPTNRGSATATLTIFSDDPSSPAVVNVSGTAWPPLPVAGSALDGYRLSNDSQHVNYIGTDKHVHELYVTAGAAWVDNDLTEQAGAVPPTVTSALEGYRLSDDSQHVFFIGTDKHVYELYVTAGAGWIYNDLTALARAVPPNPTTALDGYRLSDDSKHVNFIGTDNHVHELYIARGGRWVDNDLTALAGAVPPVVTSALHGYRLSDDSEHVFFIGTDNHVHELYLTRGAAWVDNDLTTLAGAVPPTPASALDGYRLSDDSKHVNFIGTDNHVHELYIHAGAAWVDNDLTSEAGAVPPTPASALDGYRLSDDSQHVFFIGTDNHVHELYIVAGAAWVDIDLTTLAGAVPPTPTTAIDGYRLSNDSKHVNYIGTDNHVHELYFTAGAGWVDNDLTALT